jgi:hypothetical protein
VLNSEGVANDADAVRSDPRWAIFELAQPILIDALAPDGVIDARLVASFPNSDDFVIWLCTATDEQRDALPQRSPRLEQARTILSQTGFPAAQLHGLGTVAQSQQTVDRDYQGSWFFALR